MAAERTRPRAPGPRRDRRSAVLVGLMLTMGLAAMDSTIVATAIPQVVADLGGFASFPWVFSIYLLMQAVTIPLYGKLADQFGRKPMLMVGTTIFLAGSMLSGLAWSMPALIAFRGLQGMGAGAIQPMVTTVAGDLYNVRERARIQGYLSSVWGISAVVGPALGGLLVQYASWNWIFFINLPIGALAMVVIQRFFAERPERRSHDIDYAGSVVLVTALTVLMLALLEGGVRWPWSSPTSIGLFAGAGLLLMLFARIERHAAEPVLPPWLLARRDVSIANLATVSVGMLLIGLSSYLPTFAQGVLGASPLVAGFALASMSIGWPLASSQAGRVYLRIGFRWTALIGSCISAAAGLLFVNLSPDAAPWQAAIDSFVMGIGLGFTSTSLIVGLQSLVGWGERGVVTGGNMFARTLGSTVGVALFGSIVNSTVTGALGARTQVSLASAGSRLGDPARAPAAVQDALYLGVHRLFWGLVIVAGVAVLCELAMPDHRVADDHAAGAVPAEHRRS